MRSAANGTSGPDRVWVLSSRVEVPFPRKGTETDNKILILDNLCES